MNEKIDKFKLEDLGYSDFFKNSKASEIDASFVPARIIAEHKELYILRNEVSEFSAKITGKMMFTASSREDYPAVGDWVLITVLDDEKAVIHEILPRKTVLKRKSIAKMDAQIIAANIDLAFIIQALDRDYNLNRFERYFALAQSGKIKPAIVLNKTDLIDEEELASKISEIKERFNDIDIYATSTLTGQGLSVLKQDINRGLTYCFLGSSGVGKSSIINMLLGKELLKTGEISSHTSKGKHVTTHRELFVLDSGGVVIDNPGMREVGLVDSDTGIKNVFCEFDELSRSCRFIDCTHEHEPGCAVLDAVRSGEIDEQKYENYMRLVRENEFNTMNKIEKRQKDKKFGKFIKQAKKDIRKYK
ncbi:MAG: ribosome small subunit-dependent GTPase A [Candidatus Omnitrophica bacterium]|nr:ribosome small subunit-dependent GTPase A [Candidatus Omnitrophota bacterium]